MLTPARKIVLFGGGGIKYLFQDEFNDTLAAGLVNGSNATPGPGTRVVTDTGNKLTIASGLLTYAGGVGWGDPGLWYGSLARAVGRLFIARVLVSNNTGNDSIYGFDNNQAGVAQYNSIYFAWSKLYPQNNGLQGPIIGVYAINTTYTVVVVLRTTGAYFFIKGGAFTNWALLWIDKSDSTTPLYPTCCNAGSNYKIDFVRIPDEKWLPASLCYDTFTRANGVLGNTEISGPDGQPIPIRAWTDTTGTWGVSTNKAMCSALVGGIGIATVNAGVRDILIGAAVTVAGGTAGIVASYVDANNYIYAYHNATNATLIKVVAGVPTTLIDAAAAYAAGGILLVIIDGTSVSMYYNGFLINTTQTVSDAGLLTGTLAGLFTSDITNGLDTFQVFGRGTNGEYSALNKYIA